ncbi:MULTISPECIES: NAD(P)/FAD-dependent oxidoreductase [unclassified Pedobacter]|uniref:NAD(P)/FAD-dependent oxidoreductase n=1 Tax=unclassified Pedobacter TaxID=2628915 RepID=UPI001423B47C|nr:MULTISPECIES: NAD(P)/FAD-dependent oxidoreductase [unclassified Pedobacter]NII85702.1 thioredoxin reductase [Pedobacter sp. SG908]NMN39380.1 thioredoxin reductase [Pedobacter sp. SG918]
MDFDVIIIGGSYAGLSAALALSRATRSVLIIDAGKPCNRQTPHSHNFLTHDGDKPADIANTAKAEVLKYPTARFLEGKAILARQIDGGFSIGVENTGSFTARKILLATGLKDVLPNIKGLADCWAISAIHCPYCHGYEVKNEKIGLLMNGDHAFEMAKNLHLWNKDLTILTNGKSQLSAEQTEKLRSKSIIIIEDEVVELLHNNGYLDHVVFKNGEKIALRAIYVKSDVEQHYNFSEQLGFELTDFKTIKVDEQQQSTAKGVYAAGDCATLFRSLSIVTAAGTMAAVVMNKEMISEDF